MPPGYLEQWVSGEIQADQNFTTDEYELTQRARVTNAAAVSLLAHEIPRRLGQEATPAMLSADKKVTKKLYHRWLGFIMQWGGEEADIAEAIAADEEELRRVAAQMDHPADLLAFTEYMNRQISYVAVNALHHDQRKWGNRIVARLYNELAVVDQAVKEYLQKIEITEE